MQPPNEGQYPPPGGYPPAQPYPGQQYPSQNPPPGQYPPSQPYPAQYPPSQPYPAQYPPSQPYPAQYPPSQPYPGQYPPSQQYPPPSGQSMMTQPPKRTSFVRNRLVAGGIALVIILALVGAAAWHAQSAPSTLKAFYDDFFSYKYDQAFALICPDKQSSVQPSFDTLKTQFQTFQNQVTIDTSQLQYSVSNSSLTSADVHVHGNVTLAGGGISQSVAFDEIDAMALNGFGWCVNIDQFSSGG